MAYIMKISNIQPQNDPKLDETKMYATTKQEGEKKPFRIPDSIKVTSKTQLDKELQFICLDSLTIS